uniref:Uncharacterized protein n=1 Tax=Opuntia streptacantha TaxID=393608 RepID=A0A7C9EL56_OPUST
MSNSIFMSIPNNLLMNCGSFLIIPGARSLASASVITNSTARCLVPSSSCSASAIWSMEPTTSTSCRLRNLGSLPANSINNSRASWAVTSWPEFKASVNVLIIAGNRSWNLSLSEEVSRHWMKLTSAFKEAIRTSGLGEFVRQLKNTAWSSLI